MLGYRVLVVALVVLAVLTCATQAAEGEKKKQKGSKNKKERNRRVRRLERKVVGMEGAMAEDVARLEELRTNLGEQRERMQEVEALVNLHGDDVSSLRETLVKLQQVHDQIWRSLAELGKGNQEQANLAAERWEAQQLQTSRVDRYLEGLEAKQEEYVSLFQARCDAQDKRITDLDLYVREAGAGGGGSDGQSGDLYARLVMLEAAIDGLIVQFHQHVLDGTDGVRPAGDTNPGGNAVTNAQVEGAVAVLQDENAALKSTIAFQQRKLDKLEEHVSKIYKMFDACRCEEANAGSSHTVSNSLEEDKPVTPPGGITRPRNHLSTQVKEGVQQDESDGEAYTGPVQPFTRRTQDVQPTARPAPVAVTARPAPGAVTTRAKTTKTTESYQPQAQYPADCTDLYHSGQRSDGIYFIAAQVGKERRPMDVFCDMTTAGGGWTIIQRRLDGSVLFNRTWHQYKRRFGKIRGEYWLGLDNMYFLTNQRNYTLRIDMEDWEGHSAWARYDVFRVGGEWTYYQLTIGNYSGTAGDGFQGHNGAKFSTADQDNDAKEYHNCAALRGDGWWHCGCTPRFGSCSMDGFECGGAFINGKYLGDCTNREDWRSEFQGQTCCGIDDCCGWLEGVVWYKWKKVVSLKSVSMKIRPRDFVTET